MVAETYVERPHQEGMDAYQPTKNALDQVLIELDGCELPLVRYETSPEGNKKRHLFWKEVRCGLTRQLSEAHKFYTASIGSYEQVNQKLFALAALKGRRPSTQVIAVADGGQGLRESLEASFSPLRFILDRYHLKGHFYQTAEALGKTPAASRRWVEQQMDRLHQGQVTKALKNLRRQQNQNPRDRRRQLLAYLQRFQDCLD